MISMPAPRSLMNASFPAKKPRRCLLVCTTATSAARSRALRACALHRLAEHGQSGRATRDVHAHLRRRHQGEIEVVRRVVGHQPVGAVDAERPPRQAVQFRRGRRDLDRRHIPIGGDRQLAVGRHYRKRRDGARKREQEKGKKTDSHGKICGQAARARRVSYLQTRPPAQRNSAPRGLHRMFVFARRLRTFHTIEP